MNDSQLLPTIPTIPVDLTDEEHQVLCQLIKKQIRIEELDRRIYTNTQRLLGLLPVYSPKEPAIHNKRLDTLHSLLLVLNGRLFQDSQKTIDIEKFLAVEPAIK